MGGNLRRHLLCLPVAAAALALAPAADASTLTLSHTAKSLTYKAAAGEANQLSVTLNSAGTRYVVADPGAGAITLVETGTQNAGNACNESSGHWSCAASGIQSLSVNLGDGNDSMTVSGPLPVTADGGPGTDTLSGGSGADTFIGGGDGDTFAGGEGSDTVDYSAATASVSVTEDGVANDGPGGTDNVGADIENVIGGSGDDTLHADPTGGSVEGGPGNDTIVGDAGNDTLDGGPGSDRVFGAGGDDSIVVRDGEVDQVDCGDGSDAVDRDPIDALAANCENQDASLTPPVATSDPGAAPLPGASSGSGSGSDSGNDDAQGDESDITLPVRPVTFATPRVLRVKLGCAAGAPSDCRGDVYVSVPSRYVVRHRHGATAARGHYVAQSRRIAHRKFRLRRGKTLVARVPIALRGHYVLRNRRRIHGKLRIIQRDGAGKVVAVTSRAILLKRK